MKHAVIGALATGTAAAAAAYWWLRRQGPRLYLFAGSYTQPRQADPFEAQGGVPHDETTAGEGIYLVELDASGAFRSRGVVTTGIKNPSYVCPVPAKAPRVLYAVSESDAAEAQIVALAVERRPLGARLRLLNARRTEGGHPCMVAEHRGIVITCNYSGGSFSCFEKRPPSGELSPLIQLIQHEGSSVDASRQEAAHAHSAVFTDLHGGYMYACDLGSDTVVTYQLQASLAPKPGKSHTQVSHKSHTRLNISHTSHTRLTHKSHTQVSHTSLTHKSHTSLTQVSHKSHTSLASLTQVSHKSRKSHTHSSHSSYPICHSSFPHPSPPPSPRPPPPLSASSLPTAAAVEAPTASKRCLVTTHLLVGVRGTWRCTLPASSPCSCAR